MKIIEFHWIITMPSFFTISSLQGLALVKGGWVDLLCPKFHFHAQSSVAVLCHLSSFDLTGFIFPFWCPLSFPKLPFQVVRISGRSLLLKPLFRVFNFASFLLSFFFMHIISRLQQHALRVETLHHPWYWQPQFCYIPPHANFLEDVLLT
jgi:hypothetical protein